MASMNGTSLTEPVVCACGMVATRRCEFCNDACCTTHISGFSRFAWEPLGSPWLCTTCLERASALKAHLWQDVQNAVRSAVRVPGLMTRPTEIFGIYNWEQSRDPLSTFEGWLGRSPTKEGVAPEVTNWGWAVDRQGDFYRAGFDHHYTRRGRKRTFPRVAVAISAPIDLTSYDGRDHWHNWDLLSGTALESDASEVARVLGIEPSLLLSYLPSGSNPAQPQTITPPLDRPPAWHADPTGRHQLRYWDGSRWTSHVSDGGAQATDPV